MNDIKTITEKFEKLKALNDVKTDLFAMLIHDLKAPISEITANLDILSYTVGEGERENVLWARKATDQLYRMVTDLVDVLRLEEGKLRLVLKEHDATALLKDAVDALKGLASIKSITIETNIPKNPLPVFADEHILLRILQNLLVNAIHHSPENATIETGVNISVPEEKTDRVEFYVKDKGPGIPEEYLGNVFDKFFQVTAQKTGEKITTGLGLTFCNLAARAHNGDIQVINNSNKGCTFTLTIPSA